MKQLRTATVLALCLAILFSMTGCRKKNKDEPTGKTVDEMLSESRADPIEYNGTVYYPREDVQAVLLMGVDHDEASESGGNLFAGQSDAIGLLVLDRENKTFCVLQIDRNTICDVPVLNAEGESLGTARMQLCLAHSYGSGGKDSCENTCTAVSNLLGVPVEKYCALYMDAISTLNDAVGGVTVTVQDDFSQLDPSLVQGEEVHLSGEQAYRYLRSRQGVGDGLNHGRLARQKEYGEKFLDLLKGCVQDDPGFAVSLYKELQDDMVTGITGSDVNTFAQALTEYQNLGILTIPGESTIENEWEAFYPDETALQETLLELFYAPEE